LPAVAETKAVKPAAIEVIKSSVSQLSHGHASASQAPSIVESSASCSPSAASDCANNGKTDVESADLTPAKAKSREEAQLNTMRQTISTQLNLEILLKHRELRLIDQELAKCQIALEQLRRCTEIPYPALQHPSEHVSSGKGPAVRKPNERHPARSPAPWGVVDGPYSRHYAKWLLPDPHFDGGEYEAPKFPHGVPTHGHSTRGHYTDFAQMVGKTSRSQRALNAGLPAGYAEPKQKPTGPMILKRKSDGKMVKLVCPDCDRFDFGSAQGFINHCRIGHQRNFASHDAAAEGCGQPIELDENGAIKGTPAEVSAPATPIVQVSAASTPAVTPIVPPSFNSTSVHPLVKSAHSTPREVLTKPLVKGGYFSKSERKIHKVKSVKASSASCSATPNLAAYIEKRGLDVNLQDAVTDAKMKSELEDEMDVDDVEQDSPLLTPSVGGGRHPQVAGKKQPAKSTNPAGKSRKPSFAQARPREDIPRSFSSVDTADSESHFNHFMPLLPSPTNESTQAPSLIDDDEEMDPQSPPSSDEIDDTDIPFHVRDDDHPEESNELRAAEMATPPTTCSQPPQPPQPAIPNQSPFTRPLSSKSERPLTFIAEHPRNGDQNDRKRRRLGE